MMYEITSSLVFVIKQRPQIVFICSYIKISRINFTCGHQQLVFIHSTSASSQHNATHHKHMKATLEQDDSKTCLAVYCVVTSGLSTVCRSYHSLT